MKEKTKMMTLKIPVATHDRLKLLQEKTQLPTMYHVIDSLINELFEPVDTPWGKSFKYKDEDRKKAEIERLPDSIKKLVGEESLNKLLGK